MHLGVITEKVLISRLRWWRKVRHFKTKWVCRSLLPWRVSKLWNEINESPLTTLLNLSFAQWLSTIIILSDIVWVNSVAQCLFSSYLTLESGQITKFIVTTVLFILIETLKTYFSGTDEMTSKKVNSSSTFLIQQCVFQTNIILLECEDALKAKSLLSGTEHLKTYPKIQWEQCIIKLRKMIRSVQNITEDY